VRLGVALTWHQLAWEDLLAAARRAEELGYAALYVDGDISMLSRRPDADVLDGWTVTTALLARTHRIQIGSIRLVHFWNAARLAQAAATAARLTPGRLRFLISVGDRPEDPRFGLPTPPVADRIAWLDETLDAVRALWRGETVTRSGRFVALEEARVRPRPPNGSLPIEIAGRGPKLLGVVARHADVWNVNLPPIPARVAAAQRILEGACEEIGRDPGDISRHLWIFTRVQDRPDPAGAMADFRRFNPWFAGIPDEELHDALPIGDPASCAARLAALTERLALDLPVIDLSGLDAARVDHALEAIPAGGIELTPSPAVP
jgi:alkanesulfonate monooxygenase SsuD/methylene tetrahydromethanopterin reductase-like flavin-dependent oxidoreductase (luciferase family)